MKYKTAEKRFIDEYCDGCEDGPFYKDDLVNAFRSGRKWNLKQMFIDCHKQQPKQNDDDIAVICGLGDQAPFCFGVEVVTVKGFEYQNFVEKTPYIPLFWCRLRSLLSILNGGWNKDGRDK